MGVGGGFLGQILANFVADFYGKTEKIEICGMTGNSRHEFLLQSSLFIFHYSFRKMIYQDRHAAIIALKQAVQKKLGFSLNCPKDFALLTSSIKEQTGQAVSASTLMRMWEYVGSNISPRASTLSVLALYVGFKGFDEFCEGKNESSADVFGDHLDVLNQLHVRDHVELRWDPGRVLLARYLGNAQFVIERIELSKLSVGDTFQCHLIIEQQPLYLDNLVHGNNPPPRYVCGRHNGVTFKVISAEN